MRIVRFIDEQGQIQLGRETGATQAELLQGDLFNAPKPTGRVVAMRQRLAPVQPTNIICIGLNYKAHAAESNSPIPQHPVLFMKPVSATNHPGDPIRIPACCTHGPEVDYEVELAIVIGRGGKNIPENKALEHVLGYTVGNDVSARRWQRNNGSQWVRGKSFDTFCPLGPVLVTAAQGPLGHLPGDHITNPQNLRLTTRLNGQVMQNSVTSDMIFTVAQIIAFVSLDTTLAPGTVILTGTPQGVGFARKPPVFMQPGDNVACEVESIGVLENPVV